MKTKCIVYAWRIIKIMGVLLVLAASLMIWPTLFAGMLGGWDGVMWLYAVVVGSLAGAGVLMGIGWVVASVIEHMNEIEKTYVQETSDEKLSFDIRRH